MILSSSSSSYSLSSLMDDNHGYVGGSNGNDNVDDENFPGKFTCIFSLIRNF